MLMTRQDRAEYLANVLSVAAFEGTVSREEAAVLRSIVERIGADMDDMVAARGLLEGVAAYAPRLPDDAARRLANIEDMVLMALADGELTPEEGAPIERLLAGQGFAQADMDAMVRRAGKRAKDILKAVEAPPAQPARPPSSSHPPPLPPKGAAAPAPGKGAPAHRTVVPPRTPAPPMRTRGHAEARAFPAEPALPRTEPPADPGRKAAPAPEASRAAPAPAAEPVSRAGEPPEDRLAACIRQREASPCRRAYCFGAPAGALNPWGCRLLDMDWSNRADWLRLGAFRDSDTFVFDRAAMRALLTLRMPSVSACPHFSAAVAEAAAGALPSRATTAGRWRHHKAETGATGAVPIAVREYRHGCDITSAVTSDGMAPTDGRDALRVIRRACAAAGAGPMDWKALAAQAEMAGD